MDEAAPKKPAVATGYYFEEWEWELFRPEDCIRPEELVATPIPLDEGGFLGER